MPTFKPRSATEEDLVQRARTVLPGGMLANLYKPEEYLFVPERGDGGRVIDKSGNAWVDYRMASGCLLLGHNHPAVTKAVTEQIAKGAHFTQVLNEPAIRLAEKVVEVIPSIEQVRFACTGGEATFYALRLARAHTGRDVILKFEGAYHGHPDHIVDMLPDGFAQSRIGHPGQKGIPNSAHDDYIVIPYNDLEQAERVIKQNAESLAGLIIEPVLGFIPPKPGYLEGLRELTAKHDMCLIFDEVVTGFWMAYGGAQEYYGIDPDITTLGKGFGGGYPISAIGGKRAIMKHFDYVNEPLETIAYHGGTQYGNPVCAAAALAVIEELGKPGVYDHLFALGEKLRAGVADVLRRFNHIPAQVMGIGPTWHVAFTTDDVQDYRTAMMEDGELKRKYVHGLWANKIHIMGRGYISAAHTVADLERTVDTVEAVFKTL